MVKFFIGVAVGIAISIAFVYHEKQQSLKPKFDTAHFLSCNVKGHGGC